jgi:hypothetical protein
MREFSQQKVHNTLNTEHFHSHFSPDFQLFQNQTK